jgi:hypothetical protein
VTSGDERAERLLSRLHEWAMQAVELPRAERETFILGVADKHYEDALRNGLSQAQAEAWRANVGEWLRSLVEVIETSGGGTAGHA